EGVVNSVDEARQAVRQRYKEGSDLIKITATGGVLRYARSGDAPQFTVDEIKAVVDTARDYGFRVAAHAHGTCATTPPSTCCRIRLTTSMGVPRSWRCGS
ncbi:amidohydrolase family protein, partial [Stenotrophomonas acidaminiphila]|nr:amidohydrolase family protein [Stenotrophomonas acidaminiphila]